MITLNKTTMISNYKLKFKEYNNLSEWETVLKVPEGYISMNSSTVSSNNCLMRLKMKFIIWKENRESLQHLLQVPKILRTKELTWNKLRMDLIK